MNSAIAEHSTAGRTAGPAPEIGVTAAMAQRRATRSYTKETVGRKTIGRLIRSAVEAPSARNVQPWAFAIFEGRERLREFSDQTKRALLREGKESRSPEVRALLSDPSFDVFYDAPILIVICATSPDSQAAEDCCLAAQNLMLAAVGEGLATCPIGLARPWLSASATKRKLGIPPEWVPVFPIIVGHPGERPADPGRHAPSVLWL